MGSEYLGPEGLSSTGLELELSNSPPDFGGEDDVPKARAGASQTPARAFGASASLIIRLGRAEQVGSTDQRKASLTVHLDSSARQTKERANRLWNG